MTWWSHQKETFSALLALCVGNSLFTGEFPSKRASDAELWCFLWSAPWKMVEQTIVRLVIWDAITLIMPSLYWYPDEKLWDVDAQFCQVVSLDTTGWAQTEINFVARKGMMINSLALGHVVIIFKVQSPDMCHTLNSCTLLMKLLLVATELIWW